MNKQTLILLCVFMATLLKGQTPTASFANWKDNKKAAYTIIHDDFSEYMSGIYQYADPIATARGIKFCFGAITSPDQCTPVEWAKARTMIGHGHECINHTHTHRCGGSASACSGQTTYGPADFGTELGLSSQTIEAPSGAGVKPLFFIHPYDAPSTAIEDYLTNIGYIGARGGAQATYNESNFTDFMHLNFYVYAPGTDIATLDQAVNTTIAAGGYALREFHDVHDVNKTNPSWGSMKLADYTNHLDYVKSQIDNGNLWSATASEVITYKMQRDAYLPAVTYTAATGQVNVNFNLQPNKSLIVANLKTSVTVNVDLKTIPVTNNYTVSQIKNGSPVTIPFTRSGNILTFNVYPHEGGVVINCTNCAPSAPLVGQITHPTCTTQTGSVFLSGLPATGSWTISPGGTGGNTGSGTTSTTITGLAPGTYNFTVSVGGSVSTASANAVVNPIPSTPSAPSVESITQPTCTTPTGDVTLTGLPAGNWTINPGGITGNISSKKITGLASGGTYNYTVSVAGCQSAPSQNIVINPIPSAPSAPIIGDVTQPTCLITTASVTLNGLPASDAWTINPGGIKGIGTTKQILDVIPGSYTYTVTIDATGCISSPSEGVGVKSRPVAPIPQVGDITQPTCLVATGSVILNGLPTNWTLTRLPDGIKTTGIDPSTTISGLAAGTYNYTVKDESGCISSATPDIVIKPVIPTLGVTKVTQPTCSVTTGTIEIIAIGTTPLEYSVNDLPYQINPVFNGLASGTYTIHAKTQGTICSATGTPVTINPIVVAPTVGTSTVTHPTCTVSTGQIVVNATGTSPLEYSMDGGAYQSSATFSNLSSGIHTIQVRTVGSSCVGIGTATINAAVGVPTVGTPTVTQPACPSPATGTIVVNASTTTGTLQYSINGGTSYQSTPTFGGLGVGTYNISVRIVGTTCSVTGNPVTINSASGAPIISVSTVTQPGCPSPTTGTILVNASITTGTLQYSINGGITYQSTPTFTGLGVGTYNIVVRKVGTTCTTTGAPVTISAGGGAPTVNASTVTQPGCPSPATGTIIVNATTTIGTLEYSINGGTTYQSTSIFSGLSAGIYNIVVRRVGTTCKTTGGPVTISAGGGVPTVNASTVTQPGCPSPATGTIVVNATTTTGTLEYSINGGTTYQSTSTFSSLGAGIYNIVVRRVGTTCTTTGTPVTINVGGGAPTVSVSTVTQPGCPSPATGTIVVNATTITGTLEYSINGGTSYQSTSTFSGLVAGMYNIVVRRVGTTCTMKGTPVTISAGGGAPTVNASTVTQPGCPSPTAGTIVVNASITGGTLEYSINGGTTYQSTPTFSNLVAGVYNIVARRVGTTCTTTGSPVTISAAAGAPIVNVSTVTQPGCPSPTRGTILVNASLTTGTLQYSINGGITYQSTPTFTSLGAGTYNIVVRKVGTTCTTIGTPVKISPAPIIPVPIVGTITKPTCTTPTGSVILNGLPTSGTWTLTRSPGGVTTTGTGENWTVTGLAVGTYTFKATNSAGCSSAQSSNIAIVNSVNLLPTITLTAPKANTIVPTNTILTATVADADGTISQVNFYKVIGTTKTLLGSDNTEPYSFNWNNIPIGSYTVQAEAVDNCGAKKLSIIIPFVVSTTALARIENTLRTINLNVQPEIVELDNDDSGSNNTLSLNLSPNPARSQVILNTEVGRKGDYTLTLTDLLGKVLVSENVNYIKGANSEILNVSTLQKGVYFVRLVQKEGKVSVVQKLIID